MFEIPKVGDEDSQYDGSRAFVWLADICGLSVDLINFLVCQILALFFASFFRSYLHTSKVTTNIRHAFGLTLGLYFGYFCFGQQAIHIIGLPAACYIIIRTQNPQIIQRLVMLVSLIYLSMVHLHRVYFDYGSYTLDITGPLMVITQKVTLLTFSIHDGIARNEHELSKSQKFHAISTLPTTLEYFSYVLHFQGLMAGPLVFYKDYIDFIEGTNFLKHTNVNSKFDKVDSKIIVEPSPTKAVVKKVIGSAICAYIFMNWITVYPIKRLNEDEFIENTSFFYKMWYMMMATTTIRFKYYHAWLLADAICNNSGLGFNGFEKDGNPKWDLISNINVISFELATNIRDAIGNWNMGTNQWLRMIVYERVPKKYGTMLTFGLSALWHGFYPGYYITFISGALIVNAARTARKLFRHRFQYSESSRIFYDILTVITTRIVMGYLTFPFILLEFKASLRLYLNIFMCLHIIGFITLYVLPRFFSGEKRSPQSQKTNSVPISTTDSLVSGSVRPANKDDKIKIAQSNNAHNYEQIVDDLANNSNQCDINIKFITDNNLETNVSNNVGTTGVTNSGGMAVKAVNEDTICSNSLSNDTYDYRQQTSTDQHLSKKIRERIDSETRNIEEFIDKTVTGIVELRDDLMRVNESEMYATKQEYGSGIAGTDTDGLRKRNLSEGKNEVEIFLRKEINNANVLPAVLSNGHE
ncbi:lysophospholipid acyltransferase 1 [Contarinia nasturtii]|uniref:lysophospholipid acyltransferase 1 n=1 Tax=Contarinia nasturtii TaxID=265458 RepID=UPI0012D39A34|nr:lysophospholipid acyltransferase 1 [Contarinia nasturtii]